MPDPGPREVPPGPDPLEGQGRAPRGASFLFKWGILVGSLALAALLAWRAMVPCLEVSADPELAYEVDWASFRSAFLEAGVPRVEIVLPSQPGDLFLLQTGMQGRCLAVSLGARPGAGPTGAAPVDLEGAARYLWRNRFQFRGAPNWSSVRGRLVTNMAILQAYRAARGGPVPDHPWDAPGMDREAVPLGTVPLRLDPGQGRRLFTRFP